MTGFSIVDAAFTGFRVVRERPKLVAFWAACLLGFTLLATLITGPVLTQIQSLGPQSFLEPDKLDALIQPYWPSVALVIAVAIILNAVLTAAMNRAVLRPDDDRFGYLRLGAAELRQLGLILMLIVLLEAANLVAASVIGLFFGPSPVGVGLLLLGILAVWAFVGVRLSLASALTFDTGRIDLLAAWRATRSRFWPLLGAYALSLAMSLCVLLLIGFIAEAVEVLVSGGIANALKVDSPYVISIGALAQPARLVDLIQGAISTALILSLWMTPPAEIYRSLASASGALVDRRA